jgi:hypothetical protein
MLKTLNFRFIKKHMEKTRKNVIKKNQTFLKIEKTTSRKKKKKVDAL